MKNQGWQYDGVYTQWQLCQPVEVLQKMSNADNFSALITAEMLYNYFYKCIFSCYFTMASKMTHHS